MDNVENAITDIVKENAFHYEQLLYQLPTRQRLLLEVIANEGEAEKITSQHFLSKYHLPSASFVQSAIKGLLGKDLVTYSLGKYQLYDFFLQLYISRNT